MRVGAVKRLQNITKLLRRQDGNSKAFTLTQYIVQPGYGETSRVGNKVGVTYRKLGLKEERR